MKKKPAHENKEHLSNLLDRYKKRFRPPQASVEKVVIASVERVTGIALQATEVEYTPSTKTIHLRVPSILKTELKAKEMLIIDAVKKDLPREDVPTLFI